MIEFEPLKDYIVIERVVQAKGIMLPDKAEPVSDDVFEVMKVGPELRESQKVRIGEKVCIVGYIHTFSYKGKKVILATAKDVVCTVNEED